MTSSLTPPQFLQWFLSTQHATEKTICFENNVLADLCWGLLEANWPKTDTQAYFGGKPFCLLRNPSINTLWCLTCSMFMCWLRWGEREKQYFGRIFFFKCLLNARPNIGMDIIITLRNGIFASIKYRHIPYIWYSLRIWMSDGSVVLLKQPGI